MKIYIGSDHRGFDLKHKLISYLSDAGYETEDVGDNKLDPADDFPEFAARAATKILETGGRAILICGSGQGMVMAANRFKGIRAGLGWSKQAAKNIRNDEDSNVLALPAEIMHSDKQWQDIVQVWLSTPFANAARYTRRIKQLDDLY